MATLAALCEAQVGPPRPAHPYLARSSGAAGSAFSS